MNKTDALVAEMIVCLDMTANQEPKLSDEDRMTALIGAIGMELLRRNADERADEIDAVVSGIRAAVHGAEALVAGGGNA